LLNERLGRVHFVLTLIGAYAIFVPMHVQGLMGHPRRYYDASSYTYLADALPLHQIITWAAVLTAGAQLLFVANLIWGGRRGPRPGANPWQATTLEWTTASPPPPENFDSQPVVHHPAYEYGVPGAPRDYVMQNDPPEVRP